MKKTHHFLLGLSFAFLIIASCNKEKNRYEPNELNYSSSNAKPASPIPQLANVCARVIKLSPRICDGFMYDNQYQLVITANLYHPYDIFYLWFVFGGPSGTPVNIPKVAPHSYYLSVTKYDPTYPPCSKYGGTVTPTYALLQSAGIIKKNLDGDYIDCNNTYNVRWNYSSYPTYPGPSYSPTFYLRCCDSTGGGDWRVL